MELKTENIDTMLSENMLRFDIVTAMFIPKYSHSGEGLYRDDMVLIFQDNKYDKRLAIRITRDLYDKIQSCPKCYQPRTANNEQYEVINWLGAQVMLLERYADIGAYESYFGVEGEAFKIIEPRDIQNAIPDNKECGIMPPNIEALAATLPLANPDADQKRLLTITMINPTTFRVSWMVPRVNNLLTEQVQTFTKHESDNTLLEDLLDISDKIVRYIQPGDMEMELGRAIDVMLLEAIATGSSTVDFNGGILPGLPLQPNNAQNIIGNNLINDARYRQTKNADIAMVLINELPAHTLGIHAASKVSRLILERLFDVKLPNDNIKMKLDD